MSDPQQMFENIFKKITLYKSFDCKKMGELPAKLRMNLQLFFQLSKINICDFLNRNGIATQAI
jgi:hypothetical protein